MNNPAKPLISLPDLTSPAIIHGRSKRLFKNSFLNYQRALTFPKLQQDVEMLQRFSALEKVYPPLYEIPEIVFKQLLKPGIKINGQEPAGESESVGNAVTQFKKGDPVLKYATGLANKFQ